MLGMSSAERCRILDILELLFAGRPVVVCTTYLQETSKLLSPSWLDFFQDG
jgi:hypothetical protein